VKVLDLIQRSTPTNARLVAPRTQNPRPTGDGPASAVGYGAAGPRTTDKR